MPNQFESNANFLFVFFNFDVWYKIVAPVGGSLNGMPAQYPGKNNIDHTDK